MKGLARHCSTADFSSVMVAPVGSAAMPLRMLSMRWRRYSAFVVRKKGLVTQYFCGAAPADAPMGLKM
jgi:hypothetical protein